MRFLSAIRAWFFVAVVAVVGDGAGSGSVLAAEDLASLWAGVVALDSGPGQVPGSEAEAKRIYGKHVAVQEAALRRYLERAPEGDSRRFEARLRLARVLTIRAEIEGRPQWQEESAKILDALDAEGSKEQRAEVAFTRITQWMRRNRFPDASRRQELLGAVREFQNNFVGDRRMGRLLLEVATRFDREPEVKRELLEAASRTELDASLRRRLEDDRLRLRTLGSALDLRFKDFGGREFRMEQKRGVPVVVLYFSEGSLPSMEAMRRVNEGLRGFPEVVRVGVSLDLEGTCVERIRQGRGEGWVICWDGRGWQSMFAR
ncbi:MAG: hypothetical protein RLZZ244_2090, partial [Verrucomicrobiota bacterium]